MQYLKTIVLLFSTITLCAQDHTPIFPSLMGTELLDNVVDEFKPSFVLDYGEARDIMYGTIYLVNDSVRCVYTGHTLHLPPNVDPSTHMYMNGSSNGINAEHTYPRSKGADEDNGLPYSDLHHLFPTRSPVNTSRSNFPFGEIADTQTDSWFYLDQSSGNIPTSNIDNYSERINGLFEPREDHKGNVARAVFYFFTMYKAEALEADPDFFEAQRATMCEWHEADPVDLLEYERTYQIAAYQGGKPNPFVLDCSLAYRSYCQGVSSTCEGVTATNETKQSNTKVFPNPIAETLHITKEGESSLIVTDMLGRVLIERNFVDAIDVDFTHFTAGT